MLVSRSEFLSLNDEQAALTAVEIEERQLTKLLHVLEARNLYGAVNYPVIDEVCKMPLWVSDS